MKSYILNLTKFYRPIFFITKYTLSIFFFLKLLCDIILWEIGRFGSCIIGLGGFSLKFGTGPFIIKFGGGGTLTFTFAKMHFTCLNELDDNSSKIKPNFRK